MQGHAHVSDAGLGTALLWVGAGALLSIRVVGGLSDRYRRLTLPVTAAALGLAGMLPAFVAGVAGLSVTMLVVGLCSGAMDAAINATAVQTEAGGPPGSSVLSLVHGVFSTAVVLASLGVAGVVRALGDSPTGRPVALIGIGVLLIAAAAGIAWLPAPAGGDSGATGTRGPSRLRRRLLVLGGLTALAFLVENAWQSWSAVQLHLTLGTTVSLAALAPAVFAASAAVGRFGGHLLARRAGPVPLLRAGAAIAAVGSVIGAFAHPVPLALLGVAGAGVGTSVCAPTLISLAGRAAPDVPGGATGTVITVAYLGFVLGPALVGLLAGATTLPTALAVVAVLAAVLALLSPRAAR